MKACLVVLLLMASPLWAADKALTTTAKNATALLYSQDEHGGMKMHCTATANARSRETDSSAWVYRFISAAHCIGPDDTQKERVARASPIPFYITFDESDQKMFYRATATAIGYQHRGDDFAVFSVTAAADWPLIPIGDERKEEEGNEVLNIASPLGLGRQVFHGHITKLELDRPVIDGDINWRGSVLIQVPGSAGGSSGSAIISVKQQAIVAFLVGTIGGTTMTAIPASRFTDFLQRVAEGRYRWARPADDER